MPRAFGAAPFRGRSCNPTDASARARAPGLPSLLLTCASAACIGEHGAVTGFVRGAGIEGPPSSNRNGSPILREHTCDFPLEVGYDDAGFEAAMPAGVLDAD